MWRDGGTGRNRGREIINGEGRNYFLKKGKNNELLLCLNEKSESST